MKMIIDMVFGTTLIAGAAVSGLSLLQASTMRCRHMVARALLSAALMGLYFITAS